jgi:hypothetical protein
MPWHTDRRLRPRDPTGKGDQVRRISALADGVALFQAACGNLGTLSEIDEGALSGAW